MYVDDIYLIIIIADPNIRRLYTASRYTVFI